MVDRRGRKLELTEIAPLLARIVEAWRPYQIWLFGSRARGEADSAETANTLAYEAVKRGVLLYEC